MGYIDIVQTGSHQGGIDVGDEFVQGRIGIGIDGDYLKVGYLSALADLDVESHRAGQVGSGNRGFAKQVSVKVITRSLQIDAGRHP